MKGKRVLGIGIAAFMVVTAGLVLDLGGCGKSSLPVSAPIVNHAVVGAPGAGFPALNLEVWNPGQTANTGKLAVRITNWGTDPIALNRLAVRVWVDSAQYNLGSAALVGESYANNQTVYSPTGAFVANVKATSVAFQNVPSRTCFQYSTSDQTVVISFADAESVQIPPNGGYVETNSATNSLATWHASNWMNLDKSMDYSKIANLGTSSAARQNYPNITLYLDGQLACEYSHATSNPNDIDGSTGQEPCYVTGCFIPTPAPAGIKLNLEIWNPGQSATESKVAARITNWGGQAVSLSALKVKVWIPTIYYNMTYRHISLVPATYANNQSIYGANGSWLGNVGAPAVAFQPLTGGRDCGNNRLADTSVVISFTDTGKVVPANGGYVETNSATNSLATWHFSDWSSFTRASDYSRVTDAGTSSAARSNLAYYTLYYNDQLVCEYTSASAMDTATGLEPCNVSGCAPSPTPTPSTPTPTPTPPCVGYPAEYSLAVPLLPQQTDMWCWAASGEMCMNFLGHDVPQCVQANNEFGLANCCQINLCPNPDSGVPCASGGWPEFGRYGFSFLENPIQLDFAQLVQQTYCKQKPVAFTWWWTGGGGHMMVVVGYEIAPDGTQWVQINDPWAPCVGNQTLITYDDYVGSTDLGHTHGPDFYDLTYTGL